MDAEEMRVAIAGATNVPLEQMGVWEEFSTREGNPIWRRLAWKEDDKIVAAIALYEHQAKGLPYLWARNGPVWLKQPTPGREREAFIALSNYLRKEAKSAVFARLHAWYKQAELKEPFRVITYDRTVVIDGARGDREAALALLPSSGRRVIRRARKQFTAHGGVIQEETGLTREQFREFYALLEETAKRDGFVPHEFEHYWNMLESLGPDTARLFSLRIDDELACWDLVGVHGKTATAYYGATSQLARSTQTAPLLDFEVACMLAEEGIAGLDLMGIHSPRVPELYDVGRYKLQFAPTHKETAGLWDLPLKPALYGAALTAYNARNMLSAALSKARK